MAMKLVRVSEKAYQELKEIAKTEDISLREALDVTVETRDRVVNKVSQLENALEGIKWDIEYIGKYLRNQHEKFLPNPELKPPEQSVLMKIPRYLT